MVIRVETTDGKMKQKLFKSMSVVNLQNMIKFQKIIILGFLSNLNKNLFLEM